MSLDLVQNALLARFKEALFPAWEGKVAWENVEFDHPKDSSWLEYHFIPASDRVASLGSQGLDEVSGFVQITIVIPLGSGEGTTRETINLLRTCFKPGMIQYAGQGVTIFSRGRSRGRPDDGFFKIPFTINWRAQIPR